METPALGLHRRGRGLCPWQRPWGLGLPALPPNTLMPPGLGLCRILHLNFREFTLAELRWIENRPYNAWRLPEGLRSNPGAEDDAENQG
jgi:hypothetical protein